MMNQYETKDKTFLITGGASGLGAEYVKIFLQLGAKKIAVLDIAEEVGKNFVASLNKTYPDRAVFIKCDVGNEDAIKTAFEKVLSDFQRIDVIINNAGIMSDAANVWKKACDVNWQGLVSFTTKGIQHMRVDEGGAGGTIINISSSAALVKIPILPIYCGSKMAVLHFSQSLSNPLFLEYTGVRILAICFGPTATPLLENLVERSIDKKHAEEFLKSHVLTIQEVASAVNAFVKMYQEGVPGSIWLSVNNKPGRDITDIIDNAFNEFGKLVYEV